MPNLSVVLKQEIARIARKEQRAEVAALQKASAAHRRALAALRRQVAALERQLRLQARGAGRREAAAVTEDDGPSLRFSAKGLAAQPKRLGLSAAAMGKILGVSALSVYNWESGKTRPRARQLEAIASVRTLGKREVQARLEAASSATSKRRGSGRPDRASRKARAGDLPQSAILARRTHQRARASGVIAVRAAETRSLTH